MTEENDGSSFIFLRDKENDGSYLFSCVTNKILLLYFLA